MKYPTVNQSTIICLLFFVCTLFCSCQEEQRTIERKLTLQGSADFAKLHELGISKSKYNTKTGLNVITYTEYYDVMGNPISGVDAKNDIYEAAGKSNMAGYGALGAGFGYVQKGAKIPGGGTLGLNYLELPLDFRYHYPIGDGNLYAGFGPYFAYGIGGSIAGQSTYGENNGGFKRFDFGLGFRLGYKLNMGLSLDAGYDLGLANIEYASQDVTGHSRNFSINLGYQIGNLFSGKN